MIKVHISQNLGAGLPAFLEASGWLFFRDQSGDYFCDGEGANPQELIDSYNPWPAEKAAKLAEVNAWFESAVAKLTEGTTQAERDSWAVQVNEAYGVRPVAMLAAMAAARGIPVDQLIQRVKAKAEAFATYYGTLQGQRDAAEDKIKALPDEGEYYRLSELWAIKCTA